MYLMAMGWNIVYQFRRAQEEINKYLRIIPLIALIDNARIKVIRFILELNSCKILGL